MVPRSSITVTNQETNIQRTRESNSDGTFVVPGLTAGTYTVSASKQGFQIFTEKGIVLHPAQVATVNLTMNVGQVTTQVSVVASAAQVQTATPEVSSEVSQQQVETLPLNGRNFQSLSALMPGVTNTSPDTALVQGGFLANNVMSINGMGVNGTMYYVDGICDMNTGNMTQTTITPNPDTIDEVRVLQNNYGAQYSLMGANVLILQTKSGTDHFHGTAFEYLRNDALDARNFFAPTVPALKQNIFGGTIGGPLFFPGHRPKNPKTFFFGSLQWTLQSIGQVVRGATPTAAMRNGTFNQPITNPQTGQLFPEVAPGEYQVPQNMINPQSLLLMNTLEQLPNNGTGFLNFINLHPTYNKTRDDEGKIDHDFSSRLRLMAEYLDDRQINNNSYDSFFGSPFTTSTLPITTANQLAQIQVTATLSPDVVNTTSVSMNNYVVNLVQAGFVYQNQIPGFSENLPFKGGLYSDRLPQINFTAGWAPFGDLFVLPQIHASDLEDTLSDDWSWLRGKHYLQAGGSLVLGTKRQNVFAADNGQWIFNGSFTGNPIADYLLGDAASFHQQSTEPLPWAHYRIFSPYVQDEWKAERRLTITAGLRVEHMPEPRSQPGYESAFDPQFYNPAQAPIVNPSGTITPTSNYNPLNGVVINGVNGIPLNFTNAHNWFWAPTIGFAYDVFGDGKTALRGGYGITYNRASTGSTSDCSYGCAANIPRVESITLISPTFPNPTGAAPAPPGAPTFTSNDDFHNLRAATIRTYSLSLEHQFANTWLASIAGVGSSAQHLIGQWNYNQPLPDAPFDFNPLINSDPSRPGKVGAFPYVFAPYQGYGGIPTLNSNDVAYWNALEVAVRHPVGHNLFLNFAYTWQHGLANGYGTSLAGLGVQNIYNPGQDYGNSAINAPQVFTFSYIWNLPWYRNTRGLLGQALGDWKYGGITTIQSGFSLNPGLSVPFQGIASRPNRTGNSVLGPETAQEWFNTAALATPAYGYFGNAAPGSIYGPGVVDFDMSLYKDFHLTERNALEFRAEAFNIFNRTNFSGVQTSLGTGNYGHVTSARDPRILEFALRYQF